MRKKDFYGLPRSIQDRFIESSQGVAAPSPLAAKPLTGRRTLIWAAGSVLCALLWASFTTLGFGDLHSSFALSSLFHKIIHVVFAGGLSFCALRAYSISWGAASIPYGTGDYLFPAGVVSARGSILTEYDAAQVEFVGTEGAKVKINYRRGTSFSFPAASPQVASEVVEAFNEGRKEWAQLTDAEPLKQARLRPLMESGVSNPLAPTDAYLRPRLLPKVAFGAVVLLGALILGIFVSTSRDALSRKALYKAAVADNTVEAYSAYLARGGNKAEVSQLLLPRAELQESVEEGTVEALEKFKAKNPNLEITAEIQNALHAVLLKELKAAVAKGSLTALDEVPVRFKSHQLIATEIAAARRAIYIKVLRDFEAGASDKLKGLVTFVRELLNYSQINGPRVELRFVQDFPQTPERLDKVVAKAKKYYMGSKSLPTQYFLGDNARRRERSALEKLLPRLQKAFPKDVLEFHLGPPAEGHNVKAPETKVPTLTFSHRERLSGGFVGGRPKAMYLGAAILMGASATIPGKPDVKLTFKWNAWRSPNFKVLRDKKKDIPDVYDDMMGGTFDQFVDLYLGRWFEEP